MPQNHSPKHTRSHDIKHPTLEPTPGQTFQHVHKSNSTPPAHTHAGTHRPSPRYQRPQHARRTMNPLGPTSGTAEDRNTNQRSANQTRQDKMRLRVHSGANSGLNRRGVPIDRAIEKKRKDMQMQCNASEMVQDLWSWGGGR